MARKKVSELTKEILLPFIEQNDYELVGIEFVKEGKERYLRVYIDKPSGIDMSDCRIVSEYLSSQLDKTDPIEENYFLEVSSPGVERVLKNDYEFNKYSGEIVEIKLFQPINGKKLLKGELLGLINNELEVNVEGTKLSIPKDKIAKVKKVFEF
jgi:ribosome maturation factor RimP